LRTDLLRKPARPVTSETLKIKNPEPQPRHATAADHYLEADQPAAELPAGAIWVRGPMPKARERGWPVRATPALPGAPPARPVCGRCGPWGGPVSPAPSGGP